MRSRSKLRPKTNIDPMNMLWIILALLTAILLICRIAEKSQQQVVLPPASIYINILNSSGRIEKIELETFICGVVAAESPASFADEALKAQAVAARTYVLSHCQPYGENRHDNAAVCCDSSHCQAYASDDELKQRWGKKYEEYRNKITAAVADTAGIILCWQKEIAQAPFFSTCGGHTENAESCWGKYFPYLISVNCGYCGASPRFSACRSFTLAEAAAFLEAEINDLYNMRTESYTPGGRISLLSVGGKQYTGTEIRSRLGLDSATFNWLIFADDITFTTIGYGHGVGMCQYGANGMAENGYNYQDILAHYYPGTSLADINRQTAGK